MKNYTTFVLFICLIFSSVAHSQHNELDPIQVSPDTVVLCYGDIATLVVSGKPDSSYEWMWHMYGNSGTIAHTSNTIDFTIASGGNAVDISVKEINGGSSSDTLWFHLIQQPQIVAGFNSQTNGQTVTFLNTSEFGDFSNWDFGDGETSNLFAPVHSYSEDGTYTVTLTMEDAVGCTGSISQTIVINLLSIETLSENLISVFPNPFENTVFIQTNKFHQLVEISDLMGKILMKNQSIEPFSTYTIDTQEWTNGIYFIHSIDKNGVGSVVKIMK